MTNSKQKGKRGELEFVNFLKSHGVDARRGQQYKGTSDSPDVVSNLNFIHWEVKRTETLQLYKYLDKAISECGDKMPVIAYRRNKEDWVCILCADDLIHILKRYKHE